MVKRLVILNASGVITCLHCKQTLRYEAGRSGRCACGNLIIVGSCLYDNDGDHQYSVVPDTYSKVAKRNILVDLDKTLCLTNEYPFLGKLNKPLVDVLKALHVAGYRILAYSCRTNPEVVGGEQEAAWHKERIQKFLNDNCIGWFITVYEGIKPYAAITIDDKAVGYQALVSMLLLGRHALSTCHGRIR